jgi:hypothetical protein
VALGLGCGPDLEKQSQLLRVRLLGLRADPPELDVDSGIPPPVAFSALVYPDATEVNLTLALCAPGDFFSATFQCPGGDGLDLPDRILDATRPEVQAFVLSRYGDGGVSTLDGGINVGEPGVAQVPIGYLLERLDAGTDPADQERGIYRLAVRFSGDPNHNPELLTVRLPDGGALAGATLGLNQELHLTPVIPDGGPGGIETYVGLDGGLQYERFTYSWEATAGEVVDFRSAEPTPQTPDETSYIRFRTHDSPGPVRIYVVLRDLRGGTAFRFFDATLGP